MCNKYNCLLLQSLKDAFIENMSTNTNVNSTEWIIKQVDVSVSKHKVTLYMNKHQIIPSPLSVPLCDRVTVLPSVYIPMCNIQRGSKGHYAEYFQNRFVVLIKNTVTLVCIYFPHAFATSILETPCTCLLNTTTPHKNHHQCCHHTQKEYFTTASYNTWINGKAVTLIILKKTFICF